MADPPRQFDPTAYPREYRIGGASKIMAGVFACLLAGGLLGAAYVVLSGDDQTAMGRLVVCAFIALSGALMVASLLRWRLVLTPDSIEVRELWWTRTMGRPDIDGLRRGPGVFSLTATSPAPATLSFQMLGQVDEEFDAWFADLKDLDVSESENLKARIEEDPALGGSAQERQQRVAHAKRIARVISLMAIIATHWLLFYPKPYTPLVAFVGTLPWIGIALCWYFPGRFVLLGELKHEPRGRLTFTLIGGVILGLRAWIDVPSVASSDLLLPGLLGGVVLTAMARRVEGATYSRAMLLACTLALSIYCAGAISLANVLLDSSRPRIFQVEIRNKRVFRTQIPRNYLTVSPWGPFTEDNEIWVGAEYYAQASIGGTTCVALHPGAFGFPWYSLGKCPEPEPHADD